MTKKPSIDSSAEARLAREIEDLLAIDPSPEFLARLRSHIAKEPSLLDARMLNPHRGWWNVLLPGALETPANLRLRRMAMCGAMVAAALVLLVMGWAAREIRRTVVAVEVPTKTVTVPAVMPPPLVKDAEEKPHESREIVTGFFPLMESLVPLERGLLVRMTVPASMMRMVGLAVGDDHLSDPVQAEVLVGPDDLARAIRFVVQD